ncbi:hypothetical protein JJB07_19200 [Tumebacillus sp. ITR2]|uniref:Uncharacterized protein n=1 Tax=Tumebacillus amylolyticus TaxID=2801339 RepID=A0ABS1JEQ2_9BACL|nr:hypothetical protein [Tumebacillus amylolyticus]MBL0388739.1 hypothetical protein [Tumebacillus amylolyticus]
MMVELELELSRMKLVAMQDTLGAYLRTDGMGRQLHPEIAVSGLPGARAEAFLLRIVERIDRGEYLELPGGWWLVEGTWHRYEWKPEQFVFLFDGESHPVL